MRDYIVDQRRISPNSGGLWFVARATSVSMEIYQLDRNRTGTINRAMVNTDVWTVVAKLKKTTRPYDENYYEHRLSSVEFSLISSLFMLHIDIGPQMFIYNSTDGGGC